MEYEQFSKIYNALKFIISDESLNKDNVIEAIKNKLLSDQDGSDGYQRVGKREF